MENLGGVHADARARPREAGAVDHDLQTDPSPRAADQNVTSPLAGEGGAL
jgi:hypothetical protein